MSGVIIRLTCFYVIIKRNQHQCLPDFLNFVVVLSDTGILRYLKYVEHGKAVSIKE